MAGTDFKDGWTIQLVEIVEAGPASRAHHAVCGNTGFHETAEKVRKFRGLAVHMAP